MSGRTRTALNAPSAVPGFISNVYICQTLFLSTISSSQKEPGLALCVHCRALATRVFMDSENELSVSSYSEINLSEEQSYRTAFKSFLRVDNTNQLLKERALLLTQAAMTFIYIGSQKK